MSQEAVPTKGRANNWFNLAWDSHLVLAFGAVLITEATEIQLLGTLHTNTPTLVLVFSGTIGHYNIQDIFHRLSVSKTGFPSFEEYFKKEQLLKTILILTSFFASFISFLYLKNEERLVFTPLLMITFLYSNLWQKNGPWWLNMRQLPYAKIILITIVWTGMTTILPIASIPDFGFTTNLSLLVTERSAFFFTIALLFDFYDLEKDVKTGIKTIPTALPQEATIHLLRWLLMVNYCFCILHYVGSTNPTILIPLALSIVFGLGVIRNAFKIRGTKIQRIYSDGMVGFQGMAIIAWHFLRLL